MHSNNAFRSLNRFLFQAYQKEAYFFEVRLSTTRAFLVWRPYLACPISQVIDCIRRLSLASIVGMLSSDSAASPAVGVILCLAFNFMFIHYKPVRPLGFLLSSLKMFPLTRPDALLLRFLCCRQYNANDDSRLAVTLSHSLTLIFFSALLIKV